MFVKPNDPILRKSSQIIPVSQIDSYENKKIIESMLNIANGEQKNKNRPIMVGLAAPQIGISKRIILVDTSANGKGEAGDLRTYINPVIIWSSIEKNEWYEGCYSTSRVCGVVYRSKSIRIRGFMMHPERLQAKVIEEKFTGYVARIFQHEIDHLNGKLFVDLITNTENLHWVKKSEFPEYRNKMAWKNWPKKCSFEKWQNLQKPLA